MGVVTNCAMDFTIKGLSGTDVGVEDWKWPKGDTNEIALPYKQA